MTPAPGPRPARARWLAAAAAMLVIGLAALTASARVVDRVVYLFDAPETGGPSTPRPIFERELAFEARIEAAASNEPLLDGRGLYAVRHVRAALDRHIATDLLAHLPVEADRAQRLAPHPCDTLSRPPDTEDMENRIRLARAVLTQRVGGSANLRAALTAEGLNDVELQRLLRREARASLYLDLMVTPMLAPTDSELREVLRSTGNPFHGRPFDQARCDLRRWVIGQRLATALSSFLQSSRQRLQLRRVP